MGLCGNFNAVVSFQRRSCVVDDPEHLRFEIDGRPTELSQFVNTKARERIPARVSSESGWRAWRARHPLYEFWGTLIYRSDLNPARISSTKSLGCSHAAKCPPLSSW